MCFSVANKRYQYVVLFTVIDASGYITIEPYIKLSKGNEEYFNQKVEEGNYSSQMNTAIMNYILGNTGDKIVSMRLYDKQFNESEPNWWKDMRDRMTEKEVADFSKDVKAKIIEGIVVNFAKDIIRED